MGIIKNSGRRYIKNAIPTNDQNRLYLGLNVHRKKRAVLPQSMTQMPRSRHTSSHCCGEPLVSVRKKVIDYLASEKTYSAYRSYAMTHSDERAERLRSIGNLKELLPEWLGFRTNSFGESALTAAVLSGKVESLKILFSV
jgi:hypothetical protein